jgi:hypothetical protein
LVLRKAACDFSSSLYYVGNTSGNKQLSAYDSEHERSQKILDALDARATRGIYAQVPSDPPYTRTKYLEYFRSIAYGEASLQKHGGLRKVDIQMAQELSDLYSHSSLVHPSPGIWNPVEDDVRFIPSFYAFLSIVSTCRKSLDCSSSHLNTSAWDRRSDALIFVSRC